MNITKEQFHDAIDNNVNSSPKWIGFKKDGEKVEMSRLKAIGRRKPADVLFPRIEMTSHTDFLKALEEL